MNNKKNPEHIAIIMDGNGRWAKKRVLNRVSGHKKGADTVREITEAAREINLSYLTLYAFSTENWSRPEKEVNAIMSLLKDFLENEEENLNKNDIKLNVIGDVSKLPDFVQDSLSRVLKSTSKNKSMILSLALNYGGRDEIIRMVKTILADDSLKLQDIDEELISSKLDTKKIPDPDILIRTSGEKRISNFLLWQMAYTEFFFIKTLWPDFNKKEFLDIVEQFKQRNRTFGKI